MNQYPVVAPNVLQKKNANGRIIHLLPGGQIAIIPPKVSALLARCDGTRTKKELTESFVSRHRGTAEEIEEALAQLESINLIEIKNYHPERGLYQLTPSSERRPKKISMREDTRWRCTGCGACCTSRWFVALNSQDQARLSSLDLSPLTYEEVTFNPERGSSALPLLKQTSDGRCIFLEADGRCHLHTRHGAESKPLACRTFPFRPLLTPHGGLIRHDIICSGYPVVWDTGPLIAQRAQEVWSECTDSDDLLILSIPQYFPLTKSQDTDYDAYAELEKIWLESLRSCGWRATFERMNHDLSIKKLLPIPSSARIKALTERGASTPWRPLFFDKSAALAAIESAVAKVTPTQHLTVLDRVFDHVLLDVLAGKFLFYGHSIASGAMLFQLIFELSGRLAIQAANAHNADLSEKHAHEAMIFWEGVFIRSARLRQEVFEEAGED